MEAITFSFSQRALSVAKSHMRYHVCTEEAPLLVHMRVLVSRAGSGYRRIKDVVKGFGWPEPARPLDLPLIEVGKTNGEMGLKQATRDFPGGPVAKTLRFQCRGPGFDP